jgi:NADPH-dependent 2,4-dienoyl-CoA reductase/sulfur reductase-like enzyme
MSRLDSVVVVGASLAGLRAVQALRRAGFAGRVTAIGEENEPPYDRPPLSKEVLSGKWDAERTRLLRPEDEALEVEWRLGRRAESLDLAARQVVLAGGERVPFDGLVIATGTFARRLPGAPPLAGVHVLRTLSDCLTLRAELDRSPRVAVIGAGFIGLEVAATCRGRGLPVSVIESLPAPLERGLGAKLGAFVGEIHRDQGVDLRLGAKVARLVGGERVEAVELAGGERIPADVVLVGIGAAPATAWLEGSGLELDNGVVCDAACRATRAPFVVGAGDVARWPNPLFGAPMRIEHWTNATEMADHAVATLLAGEGSGEPFAPVPFVWSDQYDRKIQVAGRLEGADETRIVDGSLEERRFVMLFGHRGRVVGVLGINRARLVMKARALIRDRAPFADASVT